MLKGRKLFSVLGCLMSLFFSLTFVIISQEMTIIGHEEKRGIYARSLRSSQSDPYYFLPLIFQKFTNILIVLRQSNIEQNLYLDYFGDVDTEVVWVGSVQARRTGNGSVLPSEDNNQIPDSFMQFQIDDEVLFAGSPTQRVRIDVEYYDEGTDTFSLSYDATSGGPFGDGRFVSAGLVNKTNSLRIRTATFYLCETYFANRDNGGDFRIEDNGNGAETVLSVRVSLQGPGSGVTNINVDACGANPWDSNPDSDAIQACIDMACSGDTVSFTSGVNSPGYQGYLINKTIFLVSRLAKHDLTFTSNDPDNPTLLQATADLKGFVVQLVARSQFPQVGEIDNITLTHLDLDGGRDVRRCFGADGLENGVNDNWGSWLPECPQVGDAYCRAGTLSLDGAMDKYDIKQNYQDNASKWTTGLSVEHVNIANTECGTALGLRGAASTIQNVVITTAGDHVHRAECTKTDPDEGIGDWSDGFTLAGPGLVIQNNQITDASDLGIVFFGGKDMVLTNNTVQTQAGNHGMFAAIGVDPFIFGNVSGSEVISNTVFNASSTSCGGIHAGIYIGSHMWASGCESNPDPAAIGTSGQCLAEPLPPNGAHCIEGVLCQEWTYIAPGTTFKLQNNSVTGAQVNYLVEGLDSHGWFILSGNSSLAPQMTDWEAAQYGCVTGDFNDTWTTIEWASHHPTLPGWTDQRIHCAR